MEERRAAVIGGGPAGLMAAEVLSAKGFGVDIYDKMPSLGRKFLMAGKSGLNITHAEDAPLFLRRYTEDEGRIAPLIADFGPSEVIALMRILGQAPHRGPSGRIFPASMKASPMLRAWLRRLADRGVGLKTRHEWTGFSPDGTLRFETPEGTRLVRPAVTVLALGGASWRRLGSDGAWAEILHDIGAPILPFVPSNAGVLMDWSPHLADRFAGAAVKSVRLSIDTASGPVSSRAEFVISARGAESGAIYALSAPIRAALAQKGEARLVLDLLPDLSHDHIAARLARARRGQSLSNHLRRAVKIAGVKAALLREVAPRGALHDPAACARWLKALPLAVTGFAPLDEAISTAGGLAMTGLGEDLSLAAAPGVFCAGEMLAWDAPTGGYLITACLATGHKAGLGAAAYLQALGACELQT